MKRGHAFVESISADIARKSAQMGQRALLDVSVLDRSNSIALIAPGRTSSNGSCRLLKARDGWIAANLPREEDLRSVAALLEAEENATPWAMLEKHAPAKSCADLIARAEMLGLAIAQANETPMPAQPCAIRYANKSPRQRRDRLRVVDLSSLWAGPLCGSVFAAMGADVAKIDSAGRPDPTPATAPLFDKRLNGLKQRVSIDFASQDEINSLLEQIAQCDVLITSARARALDALGLSQTRLFARNPKLVWVAITGHGWEFSRVAFGDDAAASGGLLHWDDGAPSFIGDAFADPLTGLAAADSALDALQQDGGAFIDASMARISAFVAAGA